MKRPDFEIRRALQAKDAPLAMAEYRRAETLVRENMQKLRALRLAIKPESQKTHPKKLARRRTSESAPR